MRNASKNNGFNIPKRVPISSIFIDESGSKNSRGGFFVVGFVKSRDTSALTRSVSDLRQKHRYFDEIKFGSIRTSTLPFYFDLVKTLAISDVRVGGSVYSSRTAFADTLPTWKAQAIMSRRLVVANLNRGELVNVFLDLVQTPRGESVADTVCRGANRKLGCRAVVAVYDMDSKAHDAIQLADIVAGAIHYERRMWEGDTREAPGGTTSPKARVAARFRRAFELDSFADVQKGKVSILTMKFPFTC